jgi:hypothetical protein
MVSHHWQSSKSPLPKRAPLNHAETSTSVPSRSEYRWEGSVSVGNGVSLVDSDRKGRQQHFPVCPTSHGRRTSLEIEQNSEQAHDWAQNRSCCLNTSVSMYPNAGVPSRAFPRVGALKRSEGDPTRGGGAARRRLTGLTAAVHLLVRFSSLSSHWLLVRIALDSSAQSKSRSRNSRSARAREEKSWRQRQAIWDLKQSSTRERRVLQHLRPDAIVTGRLRWLEEAREDVQEDRPAQQQPCPICQCRGRTTSSSLQHLSTLPSVYFYRASSDGQWCCVLQCILASGT